MLMFPLSADQTVDFAFIGATLEGPPTSQPSLQSYKVRTDPGAGMGGWKMSFDVGNVWLNASQCTGVCKHCLCFLVLSPGLVIAGLLHSCIQVFVMGCNHNLTCPLDWKVVSIQLQRPGGHTGQRRISALALWNCRVRVQKWRK